MPAPKKRVLFLCTGNSCRSHIGEGLLRHLGGERFESFSAGSQPAGFVHPLAIRAMAEIGIDISWHRSKSIAEFLPPSGTPPDLVVSVCDTAARECPRFPGNVERLHIPFDDPARASGSEEEKLAVFRRVRDEMRAAILETFALTEPD
jgi:arsenate reductase